MSSFLRILNCAFACLAFTACAAVAKAQESNESYEPKKQVTRDLPNAFWIHNDVLSGGMPHGAAGFEELRSLGIKTIISVDGIRPEVKLAQENGMRYVHLPHGYDGIPDARVLEIAKAIRDLPKPIYIHCHHGKHRGPTAAASACITAGLIPQSAGAKILAAAGTNPAFRGLFETTGRAHAVETETLDGLVIEFKSVAQIPPLTEAMVAMDEVFDRMKAAKQRDWKASSNDSATDALLLKEQYMELHRSESQQDHEPEFLTFLVQGQQIAEKLEAKLAEYRDTKTPTQEMLQSVHQTFQRMSENCSTCHAHFRDKPKPNQTAN